MKGTKIINKSDIKKALGMRGPVGGLVSSLAMPLLGLNKVNRYNDRCKQYQGPEFSAHILKECGIEYELDQQQFDNIPQDGAFITISNHPIGSADGLILDTVIGTMRPDFKILTNFILSMIPSLKDSFIAVNPFSDNVSNRSSMSGVRTAIEHLQSGGCLGLFPSGEVATYQKGDKRTALKNHVVEDIPWPVSMVKIIKNANVPVIPVYFEANNSKFFHFVGKINPIFRTARLVKELFNKRGQTIPMRIGKAISASEIAEFGTDYEALGAYLRSRIYAMESEFEKGKSDAPASEVYTVPIALPSDKKGLIKEFERLKNAGNKLFDTSNYQCYLADYKDIPVTITELGRRREEAFRANGEGTNKAIDTDIYDTYYKHLILWDSKQRKIAGAYRLGIGKEIYEQHDGTKGFYTNLFFNYSEAMSDTLKESMELGRSFVSVDYQKEALPLMLLLKGLMYSLMRYPDIKYFIGPMSISNDYPMFYKSIMAYYLSECHSLALPEGYVTPTTPFTPDYLRVNPKDLLQRKMDNIEKFDRFLLKMSDGKYRLPTLVKKYIKINAKVLCFNVDPDFNYSLDGLILQKITDYPRQEILMMTKDVTNPIERETILNRFNYSLKDGKK